MSLSLGHLTGFKAAVNIFRIFPQSVAVLGTHFSGLGVDITDSNTYNLISRKVSKHSECHVCGILSDNTLSHVRVIVSPQRLMGRTDLII